MTDDQVTPGATERPADPTAAVRSKIYAARLGMLRRQLAEAQPAHGPYDLANADAALHLALAALAAARVLADPADVPIAVDPGTPPADLAEVLGRLAEVRAAFDLVAYNVGQHVSRLHLVALQHGVAGPPGSTPSVEVEAIMRELLDAERTGPAVARRYEGAIDRLRRLSLRPSDQPGR